MSNVRSGSLGATRACPHCGDTILESAAVCPACRHHLRYDSEAAVAQSQQPSPVPSPLRIEGSIQQPADAEAWEYSVVVTIRDDNGKEIAHKLIGVGAMMPNEKRTFTLAVEVVPSKSRRGGKSTRH